MTRKTSAFLPNWARVTGAVLVLGLFFAGCLPAIMSRLGYPYIPSAEWMVQARVPTRAVGALMAVVFIVAVGMKLRFDKSTFQKIKSSLLFLFCIPFGFFVGSGAVTMGGPMIAAWVMGVETRLPYAVLDNAARDSSTCKRPVKLEDLPFSFNEICGLPEEFRASFKIGDTIIVNGSGTRLGIYVESASRPN